MSHRLVFPLPRSTVRVPFWLALGLPGVVLAQQAAQVTQPPGVTVRVAAIE